MERGSPDQISHWRRKYGTLKNGYFTYYMYLDSPMHSGKVVLKNIACHREEKSLLCPGGRAQERKGIIIRFEAFHRLLGWVGDVAD